MAPLNICVYKITDRASDCWSAFEGADAKLWQIQLDHPARPSCPAVVIRWVRLYMRGICGHMPYAECGRLQHICGHMQRHLRAYVVACRVLGVLRTTRICGTYAHGACHNPSRQCTACVKCGHMCRHMSYAHPN